MTKQEAIAAMKEGYKVTHRYFSDDEWVTMEGSKFLFEDGCKVPYDLFWQDRISPAWDIDWEIKAIHNEQD